jgi:hypothetical protein
MRYVGKPRKAHAAAKKLLQALVSASPTKQNLLPPSTSSLWCNRNGGLALRLYFQQHMYMQRNRGVAILWTSRSFAPEQSSGIKFTPLLLLSPTDEAEYMNILSILPYL